MGKLQLLNEYLKKLVPRFVAVYDLFITHHTKARVIQANCVRAGPEEIFRKILEAWQPGAVRRSKMDAKDRLRKVASCFLRQR